MNKILIGGFILIVAGIVYFTGLYTYFQSKEVNEELPMTSEQSQAQTLVQGTFVDVDAVHKGSGTARIIREENKIQDLSKQYLRLENFNVTNGPDLYVYLSESKTPGGDLQSLDKYISLGVLKENSGNQTYEIPPQFQGYHTAVIWCQRFGVLFTYAVMQ